ncbi:hypothetical protein [Variovorax sp. PBL-E5]|uniref:hypothetical protein n=1 Tax=Variovorax sp. PBL-E5 TaxID=434014 RepID=UPI001318686C|nr:hypothetical protein [Variovorax sp. PBL-E5]VTU38504.1 hypothetical protein E5CHR_04836 [Variovorax sp. PBL-E5]
MAQRQPIFTHEEVKLFFYELSAKFRDGVRSPDAFLYVVFTLVGVGWATLAIPKINSSHTSPETVGVYVIGILVTVLLDGMLTWKSKGGDNKYGHAIAVLCMCVSLLLIVVVSYFSANKSPPTAPGGEPIWKACSYPVLCASFVLSVLMALVLAGFEAGPPAVGPLDRSLNAVEDGNA